MIRFDGMVTIELTDDEFRRIIDALEYRASTHVKNSNQLLEDIGKRKTPHPNQQSLLFDNDADVYGTVESINQIINNMINQAKSSGKFTIASHGK